MFILTGQMFDIYHIGYILISLGFTALVLILGYRYIKKDKYKDIYLKFWAWITFFLHISNIYVNFLKNGSADATDNVFFPIYFCNLSMYLLLIVSIWASKKSKVFQTLATVVAYAGTFGALISLFYPDYYLGSESMFEWGVFKSMLSHSTMLIGALYLFVGKYVKIRVSNTIIYSGGLLFFGLVGVIVNGIFKAFDLRNPNSMYLQNPPISDVPILNAYTISLLMIIVVFTFTLVYEFIVYNSENRFYKKLHFYKETNES